MFASRFMALALVSVASIFTATEAKAWHHHFLGAYGVNFYNPAAYVYARPTYYSGISWTSHYRPWRPFHHHWHAWRPYHYHYRYRPVVTYPVYSSYFVQPIYTYPLINYCSPIVYQQPALLDDCSICSSSTNYESGFAPAATIDPQLQIHYSPRKAYEPSQNDQWVDVAVRLIDEMAASGGFIEAEQACHQLMAVRDEVPVSVHARAGFLALKNGRPIHEAAQHLRIATDAASGQQIASLVSSDFIAALRLHEFESIHSHVQEASKALLASQDTTKVRLTSQSSDQITVLKPVTSRYDIDAAVVLDSLLRVNGQNDKADAIQNALQSLPSL